MKVSAIAVALLGVTALTHAANAGTVPVTTTTGSDTNRAYVGLNWTFGPASGADSGLEGVLGFIHGHTDTKNNVNAVRAAFYIQLHDHVHLSKFKLSGLYGGKDVQGEAGFGYNFGNGKLFFVGGLNGPCVVAGTDIYFAGSFDPYAGIQSFCKFKGATTTTITPPPPPPPLG